MKKLLISIFISLIVIGGIWTIFEIYIIHTTKALIGLRMTATMSCIVIKEIKYSNQLNSERSQYDYIIMQHTESIMKNAINTYNQTTSPFQNLKWPYGKLPKKLYLKDFKGCEEI